jgi:hypothetical protein
MRYQTLIVWLSVIVWLLDVALQRLSMQKLGAFKSTSS